MNNSDKIKQSAKLAKQAMISHDYEKAYEHIMNVPGVIGIKMYLLIFEHEVNYLRRNGEIT